MWQKMAPQLMRWVGRVLVFSLAVYAVGIAAGSYLSARLVASLGVPDVPDVTPVTAPQARPRARAEFDAVVDGNMFGIEIDLNRPVETTAPVTDATVEISNLPVELLGTLAGAPDVSMAIVRDKRNQSVQIYRLGEQVLDMATLMVVERLRIVVERSGRQEEIVMSEDASKVQPKTEASGPPGPANAQPGVEVVERGDNNFVIDKEQFGTMLEDLGPLLSSARVVPNFKDGVIDGYKIFAIKKGSLYEKIGLQNGDIIDSINGLKIETPDRAVQMFQQLRSEQTFTVDIRRDGQPQVFSYALE